MVVPFAHHAPAISDSIQACKGSSGFKSRAFFVQVADSFDPQSHAELLLSQRSLLLLRGSSLSPLGIAVLDQTVLAQLSLD
jgi:hypothetical protein